MKSHLRRLCLVEKVGRNGFLNIFPQLLPIVSLRKNIVRETLRHEPAVAFLINAEDDFHKLELRLFSDECQAQEMESLFSGFLDRMNRIFKMLKRGSSAPQPDDKVPAKPGLSKPLSRVCLSRREADSAEKDFGFRRSETAATALSLVDQLRKGAWLPRSFTLSAISNQQSAISGYGPRS
jgi:hypothetical protein